MRGLVDGSTLRTRGFRYRHPAKKRPADLAIGQFVGLEEYPSALERSGRGMSIG